MPHGNNPATDKRRSPRSSARWPWLRRAEQVAVAMLVLAGMVSLAGYWVWRGAVRGRSIEIEASPPLVARFQVDVNAAPWPELAQLPDIGEMLARRIVDERAARGPFVDHEELRERVRGIGPRTLDKLRPYLLPLPDARNVADHGGTTNASGG